MADGVEFIDHSGDVRDQMDANKLRALTALGVKAVGKIVEQMQTGYGKPIWQTGDLQRDVNFEVGRSWPDSVDVGNSLEYATFVHEGTHKMRGRPYITDVFKGSVSGLQQTVDYYLKNGF